ncbi:SDR family NAD(P)-dependent oxidoreductase [Novosphingobium pentaromativorans]|uniref:Short-chain dehydrogenase/reductase SDR n=1 Tax=Novosphingobium pentaromativorans US6-1 TaxID=1088721 RepID=G6ECH2_9SPHN|nr:SDR family oxidoreductase [Novosphingobium pentaromativorans]AIT80055.1 hypothetical protein JI59_09870 [Novosphingobium pentaromativorans US6-1]EHJ60883.1 hypothetical protein NSU_2043 [Novosphingobium pentaromativorans US6-1]
MTQDFEGLNVLVTGAASGLGRATALEFAGRGASLTLVDVNAEGLDETRKACEAKGAKAITVPTDLSDAEACMAPVPAAIDAFGRLDALINVAGMLVFNHFPDTTVAQFDKVFAINVRAPFLLIQSALPHLLESEGAVVNVASASGVMGHAYTTAYGATKGAVIAMTKNLATEYWKSPLRINAVAPGAMMTPMASATKMDETYDMQLIAKGIGAREIARPEDLCEIIAYLASPRNKRVHGQVYSIDQGVTA